VRELLDELNLLEAEANEDKLICDGCNDVHPELFTLTVKEKTILICEQCKESLSGIIDNENKETVHQIASDMFNDIFNSRIQNNSSGDGGSGYDTARYTEDHMDC